MMNLKTSLLLFLFISTIVASCGKKASNPATLNGTSLSTIFVKGDPMSLIEGSTSNDTSFITPDNVLDFNNYSLIGVAQYTEKDKLVEQEDVGNIESGNEATEEDNTKEAGKIVFNFDQNGNNYIYSSPLMKLKLTFGLKNGKLDLTSLENNSGEIYDLKTIHYSVKNNGNAFSILTRSSDLDSGKVLLAFTFVKKIDQVEISKTSSTYKFLYGAGVIVPWDQKEILEVDICGMRSAKIESAYRDGINMWNQALAGRLKVMTKTLETYPPFSDLNTRCIYTVNNYQTKFDEEIINAGSTIISGDTFQGKLLDSDIMIWVKENEKLGKTLEERSGLQRIIGHEFGHLLGLDHQFNDSLTSIMSYKKIDWITSYDSEAIAKLYPLIE